MSFADVITGISAVVFGGATWLGVRALMHGAGWLAPAMGYVTFIAGANCLFRCITFVFRVTDTARPQPITSNVALTLQVGLGVALVLIAAITRMQSKAGQYDS